MSEKVREREWETLITANIYVSFPHPRIFYTGFFLSFFRWSMDQKSPRKLKERKKKQMKKKKKVKKSSFMMYVFVFAGSKPTNATTKVYGHNYFIIITYLWGMIKHVFFLQHNFNAHMLLICIQVIINDMCEGCIMKIMNN